MPLSIHPYQPSHLAESPEGAGEASAAEQQDTAAATPHLKSAQHVTFRQRLRALLADFAEWLASNRTHYDPSDQQRLVNLRAEQRAKAKVNYFF